MRSAIVIALFLLGACTRPSPVAQEVLVPAEPVPSTPSTPLQHCCVESGGTVGVGCEGATAAVYAACIDRVATLEAICAPDTVTTTGCSTCPESLPGEGPLVLDGTAQVSEGDHQLRLAEVSGCSEKPSSFALHRVGEVSWKHVGDPLPATCSPRGDVAFFCGDKGEVLEVDVENNTAKIQPMFGGLGLRGRGIGLENVGKANRPAQGRQANIPKIVPGKPVVMGSLDKEIVRRVVRQHRRELKFCYEEQLKRQADFNGRIVVRFTIKAEGDIAAVEVLERTAKSDEMERCITERIERWVFPEPKGGGIVIVKYPFNFSI